MAVKEFQNASINVLQRQFLYTNIAKLTQEKAKVWDKYLGDITAKFCEKILNLDTCTSSALDYWGRVFKTPRTFENKDTLEVITLTDDEYRKILKIKTFSLSYDGSLSSLNDFLYNLFKNRGIVYCVDNLNMSTTTYAFNFVLESWEKYLFKNNDILPRCAGVGKNINIVDSDNKYFGYRVYGQLNDLPNSVGYKIYGNLYPTGEGEYREYGDN